MSLKSLLHKIGIHDWNKEKVGGDDKLCYIIKKTCGICGEIKEREVLHKYTKTTHEGKYLGRDYEGSDTYDNKTYCIKCKHVLLHEPEYPSDWEPEWD